MSPRTAGTDNASTYQLDGRSSQVRAWEPVKPGFGVCRPVNSGQIGASELLTVIAGNDGERLSREFWGAGLLAGNVGGEDPSDQSEGNKSRRGEHCGRMKCVVEE